MDKLRYAVFGTGFWSRYQIPAWSETGEAELVAVYNRTRSKAETVAGMFGVKHVYDTPEELLDNEKLDFVDIITEVPAHAPLVKLCAERGVPVICQKPMAPDYATAVSMVEACRQGNVPYFVHENYRWQEPVRALKAVIDHGDIGELFRIRFEFVHALTPEMWANQPLLQTLEHLILADQGSHQFDLARFFIGEPRTIFCNALRVRSDIAGEQVASIALRTDRVICNVELSFVSETEGDHFPEIIIVAEGSKGTVKLDLDFWIRLTSQSKTTSWRCQPKSYPWAHPDYAVSHASMVSIHENFLRFFREGVEPETTGADNLKTVRLVWAAYESSASGKVVVLD